MLWSRGKSAYITTWYVGSETETYSLLMSSTPTLSRNSGESAEQNEREQITVVFCTVQRDTLVWLLAFVCQSKCYRGNMLDCSVKEKQWNLTWTAIMQLCTWTASWINLWRKTRLLTREAVRISKTGYPSSSLCKPVIFVPHDAQVQQLQFVKLHLPPHVLPRPTAAAPLGTQWYLHVTSGVTTAERLVSVMMSVVVTTLEMPQCCSIQHCYIVLEAVKLRSLVWNKYHAITQQLKSKGISFVAVKTDFWDIIYWSLN